LPGELPLIDLGLDSLMGMRIKNRIEHDFSLPSLQVQALRDAAGAGGHRAKMVPASKRGTVSLGKKRVRGACGHRHYHSTVFAQEPPWLSSWLMRAGR